MVAVSGSSGFTVSGRIRVPGDKSISHRALIFAALSVGNTRIRNILESADVHATAGALRAMGVRIPALSADITITGEGPEGLHSPEGPLDCGNSGTTTRLLAGMVAGLDGRSAVFEGDASLSRRPMRRVATPLAAMGARIEFMGPEGHDGLPMRVNGSRLRSTRFHNANASAQVKSALLLAGLTSGVEVTIEEPYRSRDHTERMLLARNVKLDIDATEVRLHAGQSLAAADVDVPADPSSAAFFLALALMAGGGELTLSDVCLNPTRTGVIDVMRRMGGVIEENDVREVGGELLGTLVVRPSVLHGTSIGGSEIPRCIDELPMLACLAARASGETRITDAHELRVKESDRIRAVVGSLRSIGVDAEELADGMIVRGSEKRLAGHVVTHGDHRLAMAFGILGAIPGNEIVIDDPGCVAVSYPGFWRDLDRVAGRPFVIAIDGAAASGKSSTAQWVARRLGLRHVDSGAFYRAVALLGLESGAAPESWTPEFLLSMTPRISWRLEARSVLPVIDGKECDDELRTGSVTRQVSAVARMTAIREWVNSQVRSAGESVDVVVDGRDIGTTVFPRASLKIFLRADIRERARRRLFQRLGTRPDDAQIDEEVAALSTRDGLDSKQSDPASDATIIDTTSLTQEDQVEQIVQMALELRSSLGES